MIQHDETQHVRTLLTALALETKDDAAMTEKRLDNRSFILNGVVLIQVRVRLIGLLFYDQNEMVFDARIFVQQLLYYW